MKITVTENYLVFPVNTAKTVKKLLFSKNGKLVYDLDIRYDPKTPDYYAYIDMRRFSGSELVIETEPQMEIVFRTSDRIDRSDLGKEAFRPYYHFTAQNGWLNDPNGLVQDADGVYHMFYQYNPAGPMWGNMHWGHAISRDLIHWKHLPTALFPDESGTEFSGCGFLDVQGRAGFGENALLFYYTAAGGTSKLSEGKKFTQCLAYSKDNGKTLRKFDKNPVIQTYTGGNRDPKIVYCEELECYVLALYLEKNTYALFSSNDFLHFKKFQEIELQNDSECPDFYPLTSDDGTRHWIFSGASARYLVGRIENGKFVPEQDVRSMHTGSSGYASQTFSTLPDGRRINISWDNIGRFPCGMPFASQMGIPTVHSLKKTLDGYAIYAQPVKEIESLRGEKKNIIGNKDGYCCEIDSPAVEISVLLPENGNGNEVKLSFLGHDLVFDRNKNDLQVDVKNHIPTEKENGNISVRIFCDVYSLEIYSGAFYACFPGVADDMIKTLTLTGDVNLKISVWELDKVNFV